MTLDEFFAEAKRLNLTPDLVPGLAMRPEFEDCLSDDFREAKAVIMAMPEASLRELAIAQLIQLRFHEKYGNAMANANAQVRSTEPLATTDTTPAGWSQLLIRGIVVASKYGQAGLAELEEMARRVNAADVVKGGV